MSDPIVLRTDLPPALANMSRTRLYALSARIERFSREHQTDGLTAPKNRVYLKRIVELHLHDITREVVCHQNPKGSSFLSQIDTRLSALSGGKEFLASKDFGVVKQIVVDAEKFFAALAQRAQAHPNKP